MNINEIKIKKKLLAKNHGCFWRVNACVAVCCAHWRSCLSERTEKPLAGRTGSLLYSSGFKKACYYASWTCKFVAFFVNEEALKMFIYIDAIQVSSTDFKISTYGFWICTLANALPLYFPKKSVSRLFSFRYIASLCWWESRYRLK